MEVDLGNPLVANDPRLIDHIVGEVKSQGIFDQFRKECLADVDTKPAYQNLRTRVEGSVNLFLNKQTWRADLNKNQLRETLRKHIHDASYLEVGVDRIVDQVVNPKIYSVFMPQIEDVVYKYLGIERPKPQRNGTCDLKDLLPKDLDPISPESDRNSFREDSPGFMEENTCERVENSEQNQMNNHLTDRDENAKAEIPFAPGDNNAQREEHEQSVAASPEKSILNTSFRSDEASKTDDDEESPVFEPIDIMNLNESNASNDSHLSGISELTSHRSQSPDFSTTFARDNFDCSNQDSQLSRVSSNSRLSIVTDFSSSNHAFTPVPESKEDSKSAKDSFKVNQESYGNDNDQFNFEMIRGKNSSKTSNSSVENSRDASDYKRSKTKDSKSQFLKDAHESVISEKREARSSEHQSNNETSKYSRSKSRYENDSESQDSKEGSLKVEQYKIRESDKKDDLKEVKDLKDLYKEKIRELREKKEMTEKEKLAKEMRETNKSNRDSSGKRESPSRDKEASKKHHKSSSSSRHSVSRSYKSKSSESKESKDKNTKHESRRHSNGKSNDSRSSSGTKRDAKSELKSESRGGEKSSKDRKRRDEKKSKSADDHSSQRKNYNDRRSTDRDGSNGSSKYSHKSSYGANIKRPTNNLTIDSSKDHHSSGETSDSVHDSSENFMDSEHNRSYSERSLKRMNSSSSDISLPLKKRSLQSSESTDKDRMKKPKMEEMKSPRRRIIGKDSFRSDTDVACVPDEERVQIIEIPYEDFEEPYPAESEPILSLEETKKIILDTESIPDPQSKLSEMEQSIRQSLDELMSDHRLPEQTPTNSNPIPCKETLLEILSDDPAEAHELGQDHGGSRVSGHEDDGKHTIQAEEARIMSDNRLEDEEIFNTEITSANNELISDTLNQPALEEQEVNVSGLKDSPNKDQGSKDQEKQQGEDLADSLVQDDANLRTFETDQNYAKPSETTENNAKDEVTANEKVDNVQIDGKITTEVVDDKVDQDEEDMNGAEEFGDDDKLVIDEDFNEQGNVEDDKIHLDHTAIDVSDDDSVSPRETQSAIVKVENEINHDEEYEKTGKLEDNQEKYEIHSHSRGIAREEKIPEEIIIDDDEDEQLNNDDGEKSVEMNEDIVQEQIKNRLIDELGKLDDDESDLEKPSVEVEFRTEKLNDQIREMTVEPQIPEILDDQAKLTLVTDDDENIVQSRAEQKQEHSPEIDSLENDEDCEIVGSKDNDNDNFDDESKIYRGNKKDELIIICNDEKEEGVKEVTLIFNEDSKITGGTVGSLKSDIIKIDSKVLTPQEVESNQKVRKCEKKTELCDEVQVSKEDVQRSIELEGKVDDFESEKEKEKFELKGKVVAQEEMGDPEKTDIQKQNSEETKGRDCDETENSLEMNADQSAEQIEEGELTPGDFEYLDEPLTECDNAEKERDYQENNLSEQIFINKEKLGENSTPDINLRATSPVEADCYYLESDNYKKYIAFKNFLYKLETSYTISTKNTPTNPLSPAEPSSSSETPPTPILSKRKSPLSPIPEVTSDKKDNSDQVVGQVSTEEDSKLLPSTSKKRKVGRAKKSTSTIINVAAEKPQALVEAQKQQQSDQIQQSSHKLGENTELPACQELQPPTQLQKPLKQQIQHQAPQQSTCQQKSSHQAQSASIPNGEAFVMPPSPDSDVSASSDKNLGNASKDDKRSHRSSQRYSSDDLYKPRPLFASSSRRTRRSHQA